MYKLLLCWRYLLTRYLALICIVSVMLGVATLIVVNSVMGGFSTKLKDRLHGLHSDISVEATSYEGMPNPDVQMRRIRESRIGDKIEAMTPAIEVFAMLQFQFGGEWITKPVRLIGVDLQGRTRIGGFAEHLLRQKNSPNPSFVPTAEAANAYRAQHPPVRMPTLPTAPGEKPPPEPWVEHVVQMPPGVILGHAIASFRNPHTPPGEPSENIYFLKPGDQVSLLTATVTVPTNDGGSKLQPVRIDFVVSDYFKSEMSEYDSSCVFVPLEYLQERRMMNVSGEHRVTHIQIKLKDYADAQEAKTALMEMFPTPTFQVMTWEDKQGALLQAVAIEKGILNVLLFLIIGVAGFGILAIFTMIVTEKTRDIGILKALGASSGGVMMIFLSYGLLLGLVGAGMGTLLGLALTDNINAIEHVLTRLTGQEIFDRNVYYFDSIPTDIRAWHVGLVNLGAVGIAVVFSILPALRAAMLHPVRALRYE